MKNKTIPTELRNNWQAIIDSMASRPMQEAFGFPLSPSQAVALARFWPGRYNFYIKVSDVYDAKQFIKN